MRRRTSRYRKELVAQNKSSGYTADGRNKSEQVGTTRFRVPLPKRKQEHSIVHKKEKYDVDGRVTD
jgi:hypothetical protein